VVLRALVLQHAACEPPGAYEEVLRAQGWSLERCELDEGERLPEAPGFDALIVMGGPMSANDEAELPWLGPEKRLIAGYVADEVPVWGVCLGAQLLAASLGAPVFAGPEPEVGLCEVSLTDAAREDPVFGAAPAVLGTLQWHGDTFELPAGATLLAQSPLYPNQAFRVGALAYGLQFHLEASPEMAARWLELPAYREALERALGPGSAEAVLEELSAASEEMLGAAGALFSRWLALASARASLATQ